MGLFKEAAAQLGQILPFKKRAEDGLPANIVEAIGKVHPGNAAQFQFGNNPHAQLDTTHTRVTYGGKEYMYKNGEWIPQ